MNAVQVLTHISAPSKATDDATYQEQARACLNFEPVTKNRIGSDVIEGAYAAENTNRQDQDQDQNYQTGHTELCEKVAQTSSSFEVSLDAFPALGDESLSALRALPTDFNQSSNSPSSDDYVASGLDEEPGLDEGGSKYQENQSPFIPLTQSQKPLNSSFETPPSEVPDSQPALPPTWEVERDNSPGRRRIRVLRISHSPSDSSSSKRRRLSQSPESAHVPSSMPGEAEEPSDSISASEGDTRSFQESFAASDFLGSALSSLPMEINPPPPTPSSTAHFTSHVTQPLNMLAETLKFSRVFRPARQLRPLRVLERGYWSLKLAIQEPNKETDRSRDPLQTSHEKKRIDFTPWSVDFFLGFWNFLSAFIGKDGRAGWGVWCICDSLTDRPTSPNTTRLVEVKVYTWGEIAPHIYLLLYLASERKIKKVPDVQWKDGKEEPVIFMN